MWRAFICIGCSQTDVLPNTLGINARHSPVSEKSRYICKSCLLRNKCCRVSKKCLNLATSRKAGKQRSQPQTLRPRPPRLREAISASSAARLLRSAQLTLGTCHTWTLVHKLHLVFQKLLQVFSSQHALLSHTLGNADVIKTVSLPQCHVSVLQPN